MIDSPLKRPGSTYVAAVAAGYNVCLLRDMVGAVAIAVKADGTEPPLVINADGTMAPLPLPALTPEDLPQIRPTESKTRT